MEKIKKEIEARLGDGFEVKEVDMPKNNGIVKHAFVVNKAGSSTGITIYVDSIPEEEIVDHVVKTVETNADSVPVKEDVLKVLKPDYMFENVFPVLVNRELNENRLNELVYEEAFGDLVIVYRLQFGDDATILVSKKLLEHAGVDEQVLKNYATKNNEKDTEIFRASPDTPMLALSRKDQCLGSGAVLNTTLLEQVSEVFEGDDYALIPAGVNLWLVAPIIEGHKEEMISSMQEALKRANGDAPDDDFLSNTLYIYHDGKIEVA